MNEDGLEWEDKLNVPRDRLAHTIFRTLGCKEPLTAGLIEVFLEDIKLFDGKQHDYGSANIATFGEAGVLVRVSDKVARLINLGRRTDAPAFESIDDAWGDITVYGAIARLCRVGAWPGVAGVDD